MDWWSSFGVLRAGQSGRDGSPAVRLAFDLERAAMEPDQSGEATYIDYV